MKKLIFIFIPFLLFVCFNSTTTVFAKSDLEKEIEDQIDNLDLSQIEELLNGVSNESFSYIQYVKNILSGNFNCDYSSVFSYIFSTFLNGIYQVLPTVYAIIAIAIFCCLIKNAKSSYLSDEVSKVISFVGVLSVTLLLVTNFISLWTSCKKSLDSVSNLSNVISPVILTLMVASGNTVSAGVYRPAVLMVSNIIANVLANLVIPLILVVIVLLIISKFTDVINLNKFCEFFFSLIKWIIGISVTVFGVFLTVQGISSVSHDGISIKATKYALSNSIPIVGGFLKDGFDLVMAGSVLIKNAIGVGGVIGIFFILISPVLTIAVFSLLLKLCAGICESFDDGISSLCSSLSKPLTYLNACLIVSGFMVFITVLLMVFSASAFI